MFFKALRTDQAKETQLKSRPAAYGAFCWVTHTNIISEVKDLSQTHTCSVRALHGEKSCPCEWIGWYALNYKQDQLLVASFYCSCWNALFTTQVLTGCLMKVSSSGDEQKQILNQKKSYYFHAVLSYFKKWYFCFLLPPCSIMVNMS